MRLKVDAIFATGPGPVRAVANVTHDIPLVAIDLESDPMEAGWATSLAHPGGNVTGVFQDLPQLVGKWLEFVRSLVPNMSRIAVLWDPETGTAQLQAIGAAAKSLGVEIEVLEVRLPEDFEARFSTIARKRPDALFQLSSPLIFLQSKQTAEFALRNHIPAISLFVEGLQIYVAGHRGPDAQREVHVVERLHVQPGDRFGNTRPLLIVDVDGSIPVGRRRLRVVRH